MLYKLNPFTGEFDYYEAGSTGVTDHGALTGLSDDDHTQYLLIDGTRGMTSTLKPNANDGAALGTSTLMWSDLFLASGSVINFNNGDVTITHAVDKITIAGGDLEVPDEVYGAGWNASLEVPTKNAVYDKIEAIVLGGSAMSIGGAVGSGTAGSVLFVDASNNLGQDNAAFFWDITNDRLGISTTTPKGKIGINGPDVAPNLTASDGGSLSVGASASGIQMAFSTQNSTLACSIQVKNYTIDGSAYNLLLNPVGGKVGVGFNGTPSALFSVGSAGATALTTGGGSSPTSGMLININGSGEYALGVRNANANSSGIIVQAGGTGNVLLDLQDAAGNVTMQVKANSTITANIGSRWAGVLRGGASEATLPSDGVGSVSSSGFNFNDALSGAYVAGFKNNSANANGLLIQAGSTSNKLLVVQDYDAGITNFAVYGGGVGVTIGIAAGTLPSAKLHVVYTAEQLRLGYDASNYFSTTIGSTGGVTFNAVGSGAGFTFSDSITLSTVNIVTDTTTGTKIGTGATQKLGFWNATPVVQQTGWGSITNVTTDRVFDANSTSIDEIADALGTLINDLKTYGLLGA